jgi:hypothetical protein
VWTKADVVDDGAIGGGVQPERAGYLLVGWKRWVTSSEL